MSCLMMDCASALSRGTAGDGVGCASRGPHLLPDSEARYLDTASSGPPWKMGRPWLMTIALVQSDRTAPWSWLTKIMVMPEAISSRIRVAHFC